MDPLCFTLGMIATSFLLVAGTRAAYRNGVCDGYGYSREPWNAGYQAAGEILKEQSHRWPELKE